MKSDRHMIDNALLKQRAKEAQHLQVIEGNPFDEEDHAMFAEFERQGLNLEEQRAAIIAKARRAAERSPILKSMPHPPAAE